MKNVSEAPPNVLAWYPSIICFGKKSMADREGEGGVMTSGGGRIGGRARGRQTRGDEG